MSKSSQRRRASDARTSRESLSPVARAVADFFTYDPEHAISKRNSELERRTARALNMALVLAVLLGISVFSNVFLALRVLPHTFYAQDIQSGELTVIQPVDPAAERPATSDADAKAPRKPTEATGEK